ncbi:MAG: Uncharacterised protein [Cellvibrionales bacterium UBA7375]|nr:MAG: Uncharacterised protein [Cellvibrionales bacterium UBA7375]
MFLQSFFSQNGNQLSISAEQGSQFAKQICNDYNPIHDVESKRFCVPGDLLFALTLNNYGLSQHMRFDFSGLVPADKELLFPEWKGSELSITDSREKLYLNVYREGEVSQEQSAIEHLVRSYVEFSGHSFPYILVPLMQQHQVMINTARPLVMYQSMSLSLDQLDISSPEVKFLDAKMEVDGKRGNVTLQFSIDDGEKAIGHGEKKLVLSGLREYDQQAMDQLILDYEARKV